MADARLPRQLPRQPRLLVPPTCELDERDFRLHEQRVQARGLERAEFCRDDDRVRRRAIEQQIDPCRPVAAGQVGQGDERLVGVAPLQRLEREAAGRGPSAACATARS